MKRVVGSTERSSVAGEAVEAFVPFALPPADPPLAIDGELESSWRRAEESLRRLELAGDLVPSLDWFVYAFVRKEAVLSAQIEGTQATLMDLLEAEAVPKAPENAEVEEICGYLDALDYARGQLDSDEGLPLSIQLLSNAHRRLLRGARGEGKLPGELRRSQNWIGGTRPGNATFVPPPPHRVPDLLARLERWIHEDSELPPLIRNGLVHVQFETIHPYLDGNGRLGRLLIALLLRQWGQLSRPLLYLSLYFKRHRHEYYRRLGAVREDGDWEGWLVFFLEGVEIVGREAVETARELHRLVSEAREELLPRSDTTVFAVRLFEELPRHPIVTIQKVVDLLDCSRPAAAKAVGILETARILEPLDPGRKRNRALGFEAYLAVLREGTELEQLRRSG